MSVSNAKKSIAKSKIKTNKIKESDEKINIPYDEFEKEVLLEKIKAKESQLYDLQSKINTQQSKIDVINKELDEKDLNILTLQQNYKMQIAEIKELFGFKGDIDNLLEKKQNSYEYMFTKKIKEKTSENKRKDLKIETLKEEIKKLEREKEQSNILIEIKKNNATMLEILRTIDRQKKLKKEDIQSKNDEEFTTVDLIKRNINLQKKIVGIKKNNTKCSNIIKNFPYSFLTNNEEMKNDKMDEEQMQKELEKLREREKKETDIILNKYLTIEAQNKDEIIKGNELLFKIDDIYLEKIKHYEEELVQIFKMIQNFINNYYKSFDNTCSLYLRKEECDKLVEKEIINLNLMKFPNLFKELEKRKNNDNIKPHIRSKKRLNNKIKIMLKNMSDINSYENKKINLGKSLNFNDNMDYSIDDIISHKSELFSKIERKTEEELNNLSKEELLSYVLNINHFIDEYEKFINKYIYLKDKDIDKIFFDLPKNQIKNIEQRTFSANNKIKEIILKQNQSNVVLEASSNLITKLQNENLQLSQRIKRSMSNSKNLKSTNRVTDRTSNNYDYLKNVFTNKKSRKGNYIITNDIPVLSFNRRYIKGKDKIYKIK